MQAPNIPGDLGTSYVLTRIVLRLVLLAFFAGLSSQGFIQALANLLLLASIFCAVVGVMRREPISWSVLTHWDEVAIYLVGGYFAAVLV